MEAVELESTSIEPVISLCPAIASVVEEDNSALNCISRLPLARTVAVESVVSVSIIPNSSCPCSVSSPAIMNITETLPSDVPSPSITESSVDVDGVNIPLDDHPPPAA